MSSSYEGDRPRRDRAFQDDRRGSARREGSRGRWSNSGQRNQNSASSDDRRGGRDQWRSGDGSNNRRWEGDSDRPRRSGDRDGYSRSSWQSRDSEGRGQRRRDDRGSDRRDGRDVRWSDHGGNRQGDGRRDFAADRGNWRRPDGNREARERCGDGYRERDGQRRDRDDRGFSGSRGRRDRWGDQSDRRERRGDWRDRDQAQGTGAGRRSFRDDFRDGRREDGDRRGQWRNDRDHNGRRDRWQDDRDARGREDGRGREDRRGYWGSEDGRDTRRNDRDNRGRDQWRRAGRSNDRRGTSRFDRGRETWRDDRDHNHPDRDRDGRRDRWQDRDRAPRDERRGRWRDERSDRGRDQWRDGRRRDDRRGDRDGRDRYDRDRDRHPDEPERPLPPGLEPAENEPQLPAGYDDSRLPAGVRAELKGVNKQMATTIGGHLQAAGELVDIDPDLALRHVMVARRLGSRLPVVREMAAEVAYAVEAFGTALTEYRALHRMTGNDDYLPVIADCERAVGKHQNALRTLRDAQQARLSPTQRIEAVLVEAGIREDLGQRPEAARLLKQAIGANQGGHQEQARLRVAYANLLAGNGQVEQALEWLISARKHDRDDVLGIDELVAALRGEEIEPESDEFEIMDVEEYQPEIDEDADGDLLPADAITTHGEQDLEEDLQDTDEMTGKAEPDAETKDAKDE